VAELIGDLACAEAVGVEDSGDRLRRTWLLAHSKPAFLKASFRSAAVLEGSRSLPLGEGKTGAS
jgi:hypothetical protein